MACVPAKSRGGDRALQGARIWESSGAGNYVSWERTCPAGTNRGRNWPDPRGVGGPVGHGGQPIPTVVSLFPGGGMRDSGTLRGRTGCCGRGDRNSGKNGRALQRGGTTSIEGGPGPPRFRRRSGACRPNRSGRRLPEFHRDCTSTRSQVLRVKGGDELEPSVEATGQEGGSTAGAGGNLRMVQRRLRDGRLEGCQIAA